MTSLDVRKRWGDFRDQFGTPFTKETAYSWLAIVL